MQVKISVNKNGSVRLYQREKTGLSGLGGDYYNENIINLNKDQIIELRDSLNMLTKKLEN